MVVFLPIPVARATHGCLPSLIDCAILQLRRSVCTVMMVRLPSGPRNRGNHGLETGQ
jgi:hypothetical protein